MLGSEILIFERRGSKSVIFFIHIFKIFHSKILISEMRKMFISVLKHDNGTMKNDVTSFHLTSHVPWRDNTKTYIYSDNLKFTCVVMCFQPYGYQHG